MSMVVMLLFAIGPEAGGIVSLCVVCVVCLYVCHVGTHILLVFVRYFWNETGVKLLRITAVLLTTPRMDQQCRTTKLLATSVTHWQ